MDTLKRGLSPSHPGELLKEVILPALAAAGTPRSKVAEMLGVGRRSLYELLEERRPVSPEMALRLAKLLGNTPEHWLNLQGAWDLAKARELIAADLAAIPTLDVAA